MMQQQRTNAGCETEIVVERNRYYTGKFMTARDFANEQAYFLSRHRLHNRLLHGWGILDGLRVRRHPNPDCLGEAVVVEPGVALDCCGRELILSRKTAVELPPLPETADLQGYGNEQQKPVAAPHILCLRYCEDLIEYVPALHSEQSHDPSYEEANRIRERAKLVVVSFDDLDPRCWALPGGNVDYPYRHDCGDGNGSGSQVDGCFCGGLVPLARIEYGNEDEEMAFRIDTTGRRQLLTSPERFTRIVGINWPHGQAVTLDTVSASWNQRLEVRFDRALLVETGGTGINNFTFHIEYGGVQRTLEVLPGSVRLEDENHLAVFTIDGHLFAEHLNLAGSTVYITLKCDFILDCHGNPVDGNHLRGQLPSGNGTAGGVFQSWFHIR